MIDFNNVQIKNAMNVAFLCCMNDLGGLRPNYFKVGYKSELGDTGKNVYVKDGDGGGYPRVMVNILETVKVNENNVEVGINVICCNTYLRDEKGGSVERSEVEGYGELYGLCAKFWGYLNGMKHKKNGGVSLNCFKLSDLVMENDGYKISEEILVVEGRFLLTVMKPKGWECMLKNWGGNVPIFLDGKYNPESDMPFPLYDIEKYVKG